MFNDNLTKLECEELVKKLAKCAFPFQCAHGRPSMVVLGGLDPDSLPVPEEGAMEAGVKLGSRHSLRDQRNEAQDFSQAFAAWHWRTDD